LPRRALGAVVFIFFSSLLSVRAVRVTVRVKYGVTP
jgi:hypothetical protein